MLIAVYVRTPEYLHMYSFLFQALHSVFYALIVSYGSNCEQVEKLRAVASYS